MLILTVIGKPNAGKSNILEALTLLGPHMSYGGIDHIFMKKFIRYETLDQLFINNDFKNEIEIISDKGKARMRYLKGMDIFDLLVANDKKYFDVTEYKTDKTINHLKNNFNEVYNSLNKENEFIVPFYNHFHKDGKEGAYSDMDNPTNTLPIKKYDFNNLKTINNPFSGFLTPTGDNLYTIVDHSDELKKIIGDAFKEYGLDFVLRFSTKKFEIQRKLEYVTYEVPYELTAETLQRLIFHIAAVISNENSVILFEEPEAHAYPPYMDELVNQIIDSERNQFFIVTHSPYIIGDFLDNAKREDLNIHITYYEDYQTKIKTLNKEELDQIHNEGIDIFYNLNNYIH